VKEKDGYTEIKDKLAKHEHEQKKERLKREAIIQQVKEDDEYLASILHEAASHNFNLAKLSKEKKQYLTHRLSRITLDEMQDNELVAKLGIDEKAFRKFSEELFDLDNTKVEIPMGNDEKGDPQSIPLEFSQKDFLPVSVDPSNFSIENMKERWKYFGLNFTVKVTEENEAFLHALYYNPSNPTIFTSFNAANHSRPIMLHDGYRVRISKDGESYE
jgi:hypothetical protein